MTRSLLIPAVLVGSVAAGLAFQPASDPAEVFVRINQVGYRPSDVKRALAFSNAPLAQRFVVVEATNGRVVQEGTASPTRSQEWGRWTHHADLDFTALRTPGRYRIVTGGASSPAFDVADNPYAAVANQLLEFMRQQRCGYNPFLDVVCHPFDGRSAEGHVADGTYVDARGGWHDAGDQLKYLITSSTATAQMLVAYQEAPRVFTDTTNALGQPVSNGVPDVLDEARWGVEWLLRLHPAGDALYHQVADDRDHSGWRLPQDDQSEYGWGKGSYRVVYGATGRPQGLGKYLSESNGVANVAGRSAAALALAYQVWNEVAAERAFADRCLRAAREVYALGKAREGVQQGNSYGAPYRYAEATWADDMEWGAAELYRATRDPAYLADARRYAGTIGTTSWLGRETAGHYEFYPFLNNGHFRLWTVAGPATRRALAGYYRDGMDKAAARAAQTPYGVGVPFIWCSNNLVVALATQALMYERMANDSTFAALGAAQRDWLLGRNPWGTSMFTGVPEGGVFPTQPHLVTTDLTHRSVRGGLVDGPVAESIFKSLKGVTLSRDDAFAPFQAPQAVYHDDTKDYSSNEPTMDGTASAILLMALLAK